MKGYHHAPEHTSTFFSYEDKESVVEKWTQEHPNCTIVSVSMEQGSLRICYQKNSEIEAARKANEKPDVKVGNATDFVSVNRTQGSRGIQL